MRRTGVAATARRRDARTRSRQAHARTSRLAAGRNALAAARTSRLPVVVAAATLALAHKKATSALANATRRSATEVAVSTC